MDSRLRSGGLLIGLMVVLTACTSVPSAGSVPPAATPPATATPSPQETPASETAEPQASDMTRTSSGGEVTVVATWAGPASGASFKITVDTHSVDLDGLDLADARLHNDKGQTLTAQPWTAPTGGHHRSGTLTFEGDAQSVLAGASWIELVLTGIGSISERTLRWELRP
jgi:hypothetical protein